MAPFLAPIPGGTVRHGYAAYVRLWETLVLLCSATLITACGGTTTTELGGPSALRCETTLSNLPSSVSSSGARLTATLLTTRDCAWTVTTEASWIQVSPASGQGGGTLTIVVAENDVANSRTTALSVNGSRLSVRQDAAPCRVQVSGLNAEVPASGGTITVEVSATGGCGWTASSAVSWIRGVRTIGSGSGVAEFVADPNTGASRTGSLTIAGAGVSVTQSAASPSAPSPVPGPTPAPAPTPTPAPPSPAPPPTPTPEPNPTPTPPSPAPPPPTPPPAPVVIQLSGPVSSLLGECPSLNFVAAGRRVLTNDDTLFNAGNCRHIENGMDVEVTGLNLAGDAVQATRVRLNRR